MTKIELNGSDLTVIHRFWKMLTWSYWEEKYNVDFKLWYVERSKWDEILNVRLAGDEMPDVLTAESPDIIEIIL